MTAAPPADNDDRQLPPTGQKRSATPVDPLAEQERLREMARQRSEVFSTQANAASQLGAQLDSHQDRRAARSLEASGYLGDRFDLTSELRGGKSFDEILQVVLGQAVLVFEASKTSILMPDESGAVLRVRASRALERPVREDFEVAVGDGVAGRAYAEGRVLVVENTAACDFYLPGDEGEGDAKYLLCIPLLADGKCLGVLSLERPLGLRAADEKLRQIVDFAAEASVQLRNIQEYQRLRKQVDELTILCNISRNLSEDLGRDDLLELIVQSACGLLECEIASLMMFAEQSSRKLIIKHAVGLSPEVVAAAVIPVGKGISGTVAATARPILIEDITQDPRFAPRGEDANRAQRYSTKSLLSVPLLVGEVVVGVLNVNNKKNNAIFTKHDLENLTLLAGQAAVSIENSRLYATLQELAVTDPLTKLYRRNYFEEKLSAELGRCQRYGRPLSLLMMDIDHFKSVNDTHGHQVGDEVLHGLAELMQGHRRKDDVLARYGGEEFIAMLVETDSEGARLAGERMRQAAEKMAFPLEDGQQLRITVSVGYATFPEHGQDGDELVRCADLALYHAKHGGRNQVKGYTTGLAMPAKDKG